MNNDDELEQLLQQTERVYADFIAANGDGAELPPELKEHGLDMVRELTGKIWLRFKRTPDRWTKTYVVQAIRPLMKLWVRNYDVQPYDTDWFITDYIDYLDANVKANRHTAKILDAVSEEAAQLAEEYDEYFELADEEGTESLLNNGDQLNRIVTLIATARQIPAPASEEETLKFVRKYFAEVIMLAENITFRAVAELSMPDTEASFEQYLHTFFTEYVLPDINMTEMLKGMGLGKFTEDFTEEELKKTSIVGAIEEDWMNDPTVLEMEQRLVLAARIEGDPVVDVASEARYAKRHAAVMRKYFGLRDDAIAPPRENAKVIDFAAEKKKRQG